ADLDHRTFQSAKFVRQVLRLARQYLLALLFALILAGKKGACGQSGITGTGQESGGGHRQSTLEGASFYPLDRFAHGKPHFILIQESGILLEPVSSLATLAGQFGNTRPTGSFLWRVPGCRRGD